jgi:hypothetical protein
LRVAELQDELRYGHRVGEQIGAEIVLFGQAQDRYLKILEAIAKLNIAERMARAREAEVLLMAEGMRRVAD